MQPPGLFDGVLAAGRVRDAVADDAWLAALLAAEAALARAQAGAGTVPRAAADVISACCAGPAGPDPAGVQPAGVHPAGVEPAALGAAASAAGNPVVPLVAALRAAVARVDPAAARWVHAGATSQDILDTAAMLVARRALEAVLADLAAAAETAAGLAAAHRDTPMAARTLLQQALPTTFGLVAAGWLTALDGAAARLSAVHAGLPAQLGGAAGTLAALGPDGPAVVAAFADELGLAAPALPWHTDRRPVAELAGALGLTAGTLAKIARDVTLYAQTEVGELREGDDGATGPADGRGGSSAMPHKDNPVAAISAAACAAQAPGLVATLLAVMPQEYQRAAGNWHAEWRPFGALLASVGSAAHWIADCLGRLVVDARRMRANLDATGGALLAERVAGALRERGEPDAGAVVREALARAAAPASPGAAGASGAAAVLAALAGDPRVAGRLDADDLTGLLDPATYLGSAGALVDRALAAHATGRTATP